MQDRDHAAIIGNYLRPRFPHLGDLRVGDVAWRPSGGSHATCIVRVDGEGSAGSVSEELVVKMEPAEGPLAPYDVAREGKLLAALHGHGVPVPRVHAIEPDDSILGRPFIVMEKVAGKVIFPYGAADKEVYGDEASRIAAAHDLARVLAAIHGLDWYALGLPKIIPSAKDAGDFARQRIRRWETVLDELAVLPQPLLWEVLRWLKGHVPEPQPMALVHGDYRLGNLVWQHGSIVAVLDWEDAAIGDRLLDLAWLLMKLRPGDTTVMGLIDREDFIRLYEQLVGITVDRDALHWWEVMNAFMRMCMELSGIAAALHRRAGDMRLLLWEFGHWRSAHDLAGLLGF